MRRTPGPCVVIGGGMGGLAAAIRLASAGMRVTLIDAGAAPGGKMRTTPSAAGPVDSGPTVLTLRGVVEDLFAAAGESLSDHLRLITPGVLARHYWSDGSRLDLHADAGLNAQAIADFAGHAAGAAFQRFAAQARALHHAFDAPVMQAPRLALPALTWAALTHPQVWGALTPGRSLAGLLRTQFSDPRLRQLFGRYATYTGGTPGLSPAVLALIWDVEQSGVWAVEGGMARLAAAMTELAQARGVEIWSGSVVEEIEMARGAVTGVRLAGGGRIPCETVVFNGDPAALVTGLLGQACKSAVPRRAVHPRSLSARVWAFAAQPRGVDLALHTVFFAESEAAEFDPIIRGRHPVDPTIYVCAQDRAGGQPAPGLERFEMILNAPALPHADPEDPQEFETCRQMTFDRLRRFGLTFDPLPEPPSLTRPQDFARMFPASQGALYGLSPQGLTASFRRPGARTRIRGLYLAGGGVHPGPGVPMAILSGRHAAEAIMQDRALTSPLALVAMRGGMSTG